MYGNQSVAHRVAIAMPSRPAITHRRRVLCANKSPPGVERREWYWLGRKQRIPLPLVGRSESGAIRVGDGSWICVGPPPTEIRRRISTSPQEGGEYTTSACVSQPPDRPTFTL